MPVPRPPATPAGDCALDRRHPLRLRRACPPGPDPVRARTPLALRFLWQSESRRDLFGFLRSPYSGLPRAHADYLEGRLRGNGVRTDIEERTVRLRGQPLPQLDDVRAASSPTEAVRVLATGMLRAAYGLEAPPANESSRSTFAPTSRSSASCGSSRAGAIWRAPSAERRCSPRSSACRCAWPAPPSQAGWRSSTCSERGRAASKPSSCSASRRAAFPGGRRPRRSSTTMHGGTPTSGRAPRLVRPDTASRAFPLRRARGRPVA